MLTETGGVLSLRELMQKFMDFAQKSDATTQSWELLDNRYDTFYGATFKIPMLDRVVNGKTPNFYLSMQYTNVTANTYHDWLYNSPSYHQSESYNHTLEDDTNRYINTTVHSSTIENPFKNTGEFIAVGLHTVFDENLWLCEQGQITCESESESQTNHANLMPVHRIAQNKRNGHRSMSVVQLPPFPGTGCPWLTISNKNKSDYVSPLHPIVYWFTKTNYVATISFKIDNGGACVTRWQSMSFGRMNSIEDNSYQFPLFVAGGNQALSQTIWKYIPINGSYPTIRVANSYDLSLDNICMSNSNLLYPTKFNGSDLSNFRILSPEGIWKNIYAYEQHAEAVSRFTCTGPVTEWGYPVSNPAVYTSGHSGIPLSTSNKGMIDTYSIYKSFDRNYASSPLYQISVCLNKNIEHNEGGIQGLIPDAYYSWSRTLPSGEVVIDDKKYLSIPNGWDNRLYKYPIYIGNLMIWDNDTIRDEYENLTNVLDHRMIVNKLLIPLEDMGGA